MTIKNLLIDSLSLDVTLLKMQEWTLKERITFLIKKYVLIFKHLHTRFTLGKDYIQLGGRNLFYDTKYGLAGYQGILCHHRNLLKNIAKINSVKTIIDVGANVGFFTLLCQQLYPKATIYSIEPIPQTFKCLTKNIEGLDKIYSHNVAFSNFTGKYKMSYSEEDSWVAHFDNEGNIETHVVTLDKFCDDNNISTIDILKIDTENFENFVLEGASECLKKIKYIFIEVNIEDNNNYTISSLFSLLYKQDYNYQLVGYRSFSNKGEGYTPRIDMLLENKCLAD